MKTDAVLSKAEARIARCYVEGMIGKEVADACHVSYNTVIRHTQNIYEKIGRHSIQALVTWWFCTNFDIDLAEVLRRLGALSLLALFCAYTIGSGDCERAARRTTRRGRRHEVELLIEG